MKKILFFVFFTSFFTNGYSFEQMTNKSGNVQRVNLYPNVLLMIMAIILLSIIIIILTKLSTKIYSSQVETIEDAKKLSSIPLTTASVIMGTGIGGFINTAILHQILQWFGMLQLKSIENPKLVKEGKIISYPFETSRLGYLLKRIPAQNSTHPRRLTYKIA